MIWTLLLGLALTASHFCSGTETASTLEYRYHLFTKKNPSVPKIITSADAKGLAESNFDSGDETLFFVHGWTSDLNTPKYYLLKDNLLKLKSAVNVILVEWEQGAKELNFLKAIDNAALLGADMADLIRLMEKRGASRKDVTCVGHSLGAQACGFLGENFPDTNKLGKITGLDPAGPFFTDIPLLDVKVPLERKLDTTDAVFVQVVYTDQVLLGTPEMVGHVNIYPNGGKYMPGCFLLDYSCSHVKALEYYVDSIDGAAAYKAFPCPIGKKCYQCGKGCNTLGYHATRYPSGTFYLETKEERK